MRAGCVAQAESRIQKSAAILQSPERVLYQRALEDLVTSSSHRESIRISAGAGGEWGLTGPHSRPHRSPQRCSGPTFIKAVFGASSLLPRIIHLLSAEFDADRTMQVRLGFAPRAASASLTPTRPPPKGVRPTHHPHPLAGHVPALPRHRVHASGASLAATRGPVHSRAASLLPGSQGRCMPSRHSPGGERSGQHRRLLPHHPAGAGRQGCAQQACQLRAPLPDSALPCP